MGCTGKHLGYMQVGHWQDLVAARGPLSTHKPSVSQLPARKTARGRPRLPTNPEGSRGLPLRAMPRRNQGGLRSRERGRSDNEDPSRQKHTSKPKGEGYEGDGSRRGHGPRKKGIRSGGQKGKEHNSSTAPYNETKEPKRSRSNRHHTRGLARRPTPDEEPPTAAHRSPGPPGDHTPVGQRPRANGSSI